MTNPAEEARFKINQPQVVHEVIDDEALVIHLEKGYYYSLNKAATVLWTQIARDASLGEIVNYLTSRYDAGREALEKPAADFIRQLVEEGLVQASTTPDGVAAPSHDGAAKTAENIAANGAAHARIPFTEPSLQKFMDMKDFLLVDPIHGVDEMGWPHTK